MPESAQGRDYTHSCKHDCCCSATIVKCFFIEYSPLVFQISPDIVIANTMICYFASIYWNGVDWRVIPYQALMHAHEFRHADTLLWGVHSHLTLHTSHALHIWCELIQYNVTSSWRLTVPAIHVSFLKHVTQGHADPEFWFLFEQVSRPGS